MAGISGGPGGFALTPDGWRARGERNGEADLTLTSTMLRVR